MIRITEDLLITLLEFFQSADFLGMDEQYEGTEPLQGSRTVFLRIGTREHSVAQIGGGPTPASQFVGAIKLAAGTAVGEAVRGTFFRYM